VRNRLASLSLGQRPKERVQPVLRLRDLMGHPRYPLPCQHRLVSRRQNVEIVIGVVMDDNVVLAADNDVDSGCRIVVTDTTGFHAIGYPCLRPSRIV